MDDLKRNNFENDLNFDWCYRKSLSNNKENYNIQSNINKSNFYNTFGSQVNFSRSISNNRIKNDNNHYQKDKSVEISFEQIK